MPRGTFDFDWINLSKKRREGESSYMIEAAVGREVNGSGKDVVVLVITSATYTTLEVALVLAMA